MLSGSATVVETVGTADGEIAGVTAVTAGADVALACATAVASGADRIGVAIGDGAPHAIAAKPIVSAMALRM